MCLGLLGACGPLLDSEPAAPAAAPLVPRAFALAGWKVFVASLVGEVWLQDDRGWLRCRGGGRMWLPGEAEERLAANDANHVRRFVYQECKQDGVSLSGTRETQDHEHQSQHRGHLRVSHGPSYVCAFSVTSTFDPNAYASMVQRGVFCGHSVAEMEAELERTDKQRQLSKAARRL